jgi:hypothetical protein
MARADRARHSSNRRGIALLLVAFLVLAVVAAGQLSHLHDSDEPGLFNEEHVLAALDSVTGALSLSGRAPTIGIGLVRTAARLPDGVWPAAVSPRRVASRAPPLA